MISININGSETDTIPVTIDLTPSPNLVVNAFSAPSVGYSGQPVPATWSILNKGDTATSNGAWKEYVYLSTDDKIDNSDILLHTFIRTGDLKKDSSYFADSVLVFLPSGKTGNFYLLLKTDGANVMYEYNGEEDNVAATVIFILQPDPCDLTISNISMPASVQISDSIDVKWMLNNIGVNPATGYSRSGIYISKDSVFDKNDILVADPLVQLNIPTAADTLFTHRVKTAAIQPGDNFIIVVADLLNNIPESDENNNTGVSVSRINVTVPELPVNDPTPDILKNNQELYYRLEIPDTLAGKTMLVSITGDPLNAMNELYIRYDTLPTRIVHDFKYTSSVSGFQQIVIPETVKGTYYILGYGASSVAVQQNVTLFAQPIEFAILNINSNKGGNTGTVTVKISGARFEQNMTARLSDESLGNYTASKNHLHQQYHHVCNF